VSETACRPIGRAISVCSLPSKGQPREVLTETDVYHCKGGNQQLAQRLAAEIGAERIL
jgi:hypothetical protein